MIHGSDGDESLMTLGLQGYSQSLDINGILARKDMEWKIHTV